MILNQITDYLFVGVFKMGIEGAAYATVLSQIVCCVLCIIYILAKYRYILQRREDWAAMKSGLSNLFATGLSMGLMGCIVNIGTVILQLGINSLGSDIMAAQVAGRRIFDLTCILAPLFSSILELTVKILSVLFLVPALGYLGVALTEPISWVFMTIMLAAMYFYYMPRDEKLYSKENSKEN